MTTEHERRSGRERRRFNQPDAPSLGPERRRYADQRKRLLVEYRMHHPEGGTQRSESGQQDTKGKGVAGPAAPYWTTHVGVLRKQ